MKQCRGELFRKKNSIIQELRSTKTSMSDMIKTDPRVWDEEFFNFDLNSEATLILKADISVQDPAQRARDRELEEIATRKAKEEQDRAERAKNLDHRIMKVQKKVKEQEDQTNVKTKSITVFVKIYGRGIKNITLHVKLSDTFKNLKDMIEEMEGIPSKEQSLNYFDTCCTQLPGPSPPLDVDPAVWVSLLL